MNIFEIHDSDDFVDVPDDLELFRPQQHLFVMYVYGLEGLETIILLPSAFLVFEMKRIFDLSPSEH